MVLLAEFSEKGKSSMASSTQTGSAKNGTKHSNVSASDSTKQIDESKNAAPAKSAAPAGYSKAEDGSFEISGHWIPEKGPIHGKLVGAYDFRKKSDGKINRVYVLELAEDCIISAPLEGPKGKSGYGEDVAKGSMSKDGERETVGVWGSAGLKALDELGGCLVHITQNGKKDLGGGRAMWLYDIFHKGTPKPLKIRSAKSGDKVAPDDHPTQGDPDELPF
jgi:hypothetical protein